MQKYNDLSEVLSAMDEWWGKLPEEIPHTEENEIILSDGLFWCEVNITKFTYPLTQGSDIPMPLINTFNSLVQRIMKFFMAVKECWKEKNHDSQRIDDGID